MKDKHAHLAGTMAAALPSELAQFFSARGWRLRRHQADMLAVAAAGSHALLVADTGAGKTLGGFLPSLAAFCPSRLAGAAPPEGLHTLYVSPLKALAVDVERNLRSPLVGMQREASLAGVAVHDVAIGVRTGDTPPAERARMARRPPDILITTPESLFLMLTSQAREALRGRLEQRVVTVGEGRPDAYGRRLSRIGTADEPDIGRWMVAQGHAWSWRPGRDGGPYGHHELMARLQRRGLWAEGGAMEPREFRQTHGPCRR